MLRFLLMVHKSLPFLKRAMETTRTMQLLSRLVISGLTWDVNRSNSPAHVTVVLSPMTDYIST